MISQARNSGGTTGKWTVVVWIPKSGGKRITRIVHGTKRDAERRERDLQAAVETQRWSEIDRTRLRAGVTIHDLAKEWIAAGLPRPGGRQRSQSQRDSLQPFLTQALKWWGGKSPTGIAARDFEDYGAWKREHARTGTGERAADLEINALAQLAAWAVSSGRLDRNPFLGRPSYRDPAAIHHCPEAMPENDEELHRLIGWLFATGGVHRVAGAHLLFQAFTGLRPGEPGALRWDAVGDQAGARLTITREGSQVPLLRVQRLKGGINPAVRIHDPLQQFLAAWRAYSAQAWPNSPWMFPHPEDHTRPLVAYGATADSGLGRLLAEAATAIGVGPRKPHSMRAYYVRVRRSQGIDDATIAVELGQASGPALVVRTYGERFAILGGDGLYDWLPAEPAQPCWLRLATPSNVVAISSAA